jgi:MinD-like ATPase involved in chromosome partitioning or flagellar assembly
MSLAVLTAVTEAWEASLVAGLEQVAGEVRVARRCVDLAELLSAAAAGLGRAALLSADVYRLDREAIAQLHLSGVAVLGLSDPDDGNSLHRLVELGVTRVLPVDAPAADVAAAVIDAVAELAGPNSDRRLGLDAADTGIADPAAALAGMPALDDAEPGTSRPRRPNGRLVAVWGPTGAPGRTTVAVTVAAELAALGAHTLLVDADTYGPSIAQVLGMLDESGGIAGAVRSANHGALDLDRLAQLSPSIGATLQVLTGLPQPSRWPELRPSSLDVLWERARELARWTVVDCGFGLEADEEVTFDTTAPRRNGATLCALQAADVVLAVGSADPVGLQRLVRGISELVDLLGPTCRPRVVLNRLRASAVGARPDRRVIEALHRYAGVDDPVLVPDDRPACDEALLSGRMLTEIAPNSPARLALAGLADALVTGTATEPVVLARTVRAG